VDDSVKVIKKLKERTYKFRYIALESNFIREENNFICEIVMNIDCKVYSNIINPKNLIFKISQKLSKTFLPKDIFLKINQ
jgi:uncharacterized protein related to proFAR isomerase